MGIPDIYFLSNFILHPSSTNYFFVCYQRIVRVSEACDRVSKSSSSLHISCIRLKGTLAKYEKYGILSIKKVIEKL